ncbi:Peptidase M23 [Ruminiclostridium papyrosolvens DSM 2782]|uniref:Peptidase M23 n=1 Tax=Ruminiclostridium papyrosolvens DSM 2782 TaxID=588581 RepID=F1TH01_9FIRM|nr:M23 family metallopeptidase [Ruminiclostridium papyrosolvens]EGD46241.1 Peptidase M23 [Ruminiclostridium papyrosolvens DSM 2782]WES33036.1 M23 family metallopeptidase [Ruminiclostridium papyrosolvens DSM 2782]
MTKKGIKKKIIITGSVLLMPLFLIFFLMIMFTQRSGTGSNPIVMAKGLDIPAGFLSIANKAATENGIEFAFFLTLSAGAANFNPDNFTNEIIPEVLGKAKTCNPDSLPDSLKEIYSIYSKYYNDLKVGPIPKSKIITTTVQKKQNNDDSKQPADGTEAGSENDQPQYETTSTEIQYTYSHSDDFGAQRTFGGDRAHEGNDIIADGGVPIVSITDGVIRDMNWNDFGGNIVGVLTDKDTYFYYAHMRGFNTAFHEGDRVKAGDVLGYVGNTGYGPPGTSGMFITHLHLQIGIKLEGQKKRFYISPYNIVAYLDQFRITLHEEANVGGGD